MKTWDEQTKRIRINFAKKLHRNDAFIQGTWLRRYEESKIPGVFCGCMHGGLVQRDNDGVLEESAKHLQWPLWLCHLTMYIFDGVPEGEHGKFAIECMEAVPINADITRVLHDISIKRMNRLKDELPYLSDMFDIAADVWRDDAIDIGKAYKAGKAIRSGITKQTKYRGQEALWSAIHLTESALTLDELDSAVEGSSSADLSANCASACQAEASALISALKQIPSGDSK